MAAFTAAAEAQGQKAQDLLKPINLLKEKRDELTEMVNEGKELKNEADQIQSEVSDIKSKADSRNQQTNKERNPEPVEGQQVKKDWTPNPLKSKRFIDRITYGFNLQASPRTTFFPTAGTLSGQAAYQITTKMNLGMGASYIAGLTPLSTGEGQGVRRLSTNGLGLRSYLDWNFTRRLYLQGGYERNYRNPLPNPQILTPKSSWSESGLVGLKLKTPSTKRTQKTMEILYDFMHERTGQPALVVRLGMELRPKHVYRK
jgi:hypothetical protein